MAGMLSVQNAQRSGRKTRAPQHPFNLKFRPWQLQPHMIAPVIPGETMKSAQFQARVVTDPIKGNLVGWWFEWFLFYVKLRDLEQRDLVEQMVLDPAFNAQTAGITSNTAVVPNYFLGRNMVDWVDKCMDRIRDEYFRDEADVGLAYAIDGVDSVKINRNDFTHSIISDEAKTDLDVTLTIGVDDQVGISEIETAWAQYELLRLNGMVDMTYEDYLRAFGIRGKAVEQTDPHRPELLRYTKDWTYPSNTVDPATGLASGAASWSIQERADKDRFFNEPGFIVGCVVTRPKVYLGNVRSAAVGIMKDIRSWLPPTPNVDPMLGFTKVLEDAGPLNPVGTSDDYWIDVRDLFVHGDQFINHADFVPSVALPTLAFQRQYASLTDAKSLFVDSAGADGTAKQFVRSDGITTLVVQGRQQDYSPGQNTQVIV